MAVIGSNPPPDSNSSAARLASWRRLADPLLLCLVEPGLGDPVGRGGPLLVDEGLVVTLSQHFGLSLQPGQLLAGRGEFSLLAAQRRLLLPDPAPAASICALLGGLGPGGMPPGGMLPGELLLCALLAGQLPAWRRPGRLSAAASPAPSSTRGWRGRRGDGKLSARFPVHSSSPQHPPDRASHMPPCALSYSV